MNPLVEWQAAPLTGSNRLAKECVFSSGPFPKGLIIFLKRFQVAKFEQIQTQKIWPGQPVKPCCYFLAVPPVIHRRCLLLF